MRNGGEEAEELRCRGAGCSGRCAGKVSRRRAIGRGGSRSMTWEELGAPPLVQTAATEAGPASPGGKNTRARTRAPDYLNKFVMVPAFRTNLGFAG